MENTNTVNCQPFPGMTCSNRFQVRWWIGILAALVIIGLYFYRLMSTLHPNDLNNTITSYSDTVTDQTLINWLIASCGGILITGTMAIVFFFKMRDRTVELVAYKRNLETEILARRRAEEKYRSIFQNTGAATILIEADMTLSMVNENASQLLGYTREEIEGKMKTGDFIKGENFKIVREYHVARRMGEGNVPVEYEAQLIDKNGEVKDIFFRVGMIPDSQTSVASLINITEKKRMESQLRQAQKMQAIGTLAGGIAHDFNNILAGIIGYAELAIQDVEDPEKTLERLNRILSTSARAKELTRQILTFSRQTEQKLETVPLNAILEETLNLIRATAPATIRVDKKIPATTASILADPGQIHQVIMNLCTNAVHAMGGEVGVLTAKLESVELDSKAAMRIDGLSPGRYARLTIGDTGHGMTRAIRERIFDPFFTTKKNDHGTGMGLSVAHGIVKRLHGAITVKSELGSGSTFQVYFPIAENPPAMPALSKAAIPTGSEKILLIDDEETIVDVAGQMLRGLGYSVITETGSRHALWTFLKDPLAFDLVISDQTMPGMTGTEMFQKIRSVHPAQPFILSTGFSETETRESVLAMGIRELIMKPYLKDELAAVVRKVLDLPSELPVILNKG
ncbi:MAG: response regulator [Deltaproteobacteria bacterium]|nr:response regulator [Deltaproteobacteria bacterium]